MTPAAAFEISQGLASYEKAAAALLYWQAFAPKLGRVLRPDHRALSYIADVMCPDHVIVARDFADASLLGIAGFRSPLGAFVDGTGPDLRRAYGRFGGAWRAALLASLPHDVDNKRFLLDGLVVHPRVRGQGIGGALLDAIFAEAELRGYDSIRLEVAAANPRARALYERTGFRVVASQPIGWQRLFFGCDCTLTMVRGLRGAV
jgi:ribosomal protein S18 acetylase RimI-like enzyme